MSIVEICYQFSSTKMDVQTVINWSVVGHLTIATWSTAIVYTTVIVKLCLQHDAVARVHYLQLIGLHVGGLTARCHASAVLAMGLCPSVCLSQVGVLLKRLNTGSHKQHHTIAHGL